MDLEGIWDVIKVYNISFSGIWGFPLYSNSLIKRHLHIPRSSAHYRIWLTIVGTTFHFGLFCSVSTLLWLNLASTNPLGVIEIFSTIAAIVLGTFGCCIVLGVNQWMEILTTTATQLQRDYRNLANRMKSNLSLVHKNIYHFTIF